MNSDYEDQGLPGAMVGVLLLWIFICLAMSPPAHAGAGGEPSGITGLAIGAPRSPAALPALWVKDRCAGLSGLRVDFYPGMDAMMAMAMGDEYDLMVLPPNAAAVLYNKGVDITLINVFHWGGLFLGTTDPECRAWQDLTGKTLYLPPKGSVPDLMARYFLDRNGLCPGRDLSVVHSNHVEIAQLLANGTIRNAVDVQPFVALNQTKIPKYHLVSRFADDWKKAVGEEFSLPGFCLALRSRGVKKDRALVGRIDAAFKRAVQGMLAHPETAGKMSHTYLNLDPRILARAIDRFGYHYKSADQARPDLEAYFRVLMDLAPASIGRRLPDQGFYHVEN